MEFNTFVKAQILPILIKYRFDIVEEFENILRFQSPITEIGIVYNVYESACYVSFGNKGGSVYELRNNALKELFNFSLPIDQTTPDIFVKNLCIFLNTHKGAGLMEGNIDAFIKYKTAEDENYTFSLVREQALSTADKAWENRDYAAFVKCIDQFNIDDLPQAYALKYKIAKQKFKKS